MKLQLSELTKKYKDKLALDHITFSFTSGIYGLLGPNGAGKSTMMNLITDNISPTSGRILIDDRNIKDIDKEYRKLLGYMPQQQNFYPELTLLRFMCFIASLKGLNKHEAKRDIEYYLKMVNLYDVREKRIGTFSGGMRQRALIAQALIGNPKILILDEPTAGLDPKERIRIRNLISEVSRDKIVIIATHVVADVEFIAKEIIMLNSGVILKSGKPADLLAEINGKVWNIYISDQEITEVNDKYKVSNISREGESVIARIVAESYEDKWESETVRPDLEDLYLYLNGE